jgi:hypothetical protein
MKEIDKSDAPAVNGGSGPRDLELQPLVEPVPAKGQPIAYDYPAEPNPQ